MMKRRWLGILALLAAGLAAQPAAAKFDELAGTWVNVNSATSSVVTVIVGGTAQAPTVQLLAACTPNPCDWGISTGQTFVNTTSDDLTKKAQSILVFFGGNAAQRTVLLKRRDDGQLTVEVYSAFLDGSNRSSYQTIDTMKRAPTAPVGLGPEDCIVFKTSQVQVSQKGGSSRIIAGGNVLADFGSNHLQAVQAVVTFLSYGLNEQCFVGRPDMPVSYYLHDGQSPVGPMPGESCLAFNPGNLSVSKKGGRWRLADGPTMVLDFANHLDLAERMADVIDFYGFTNICTFGLSNSAGTMTYFRQ